MNSVGAEPTIDQSHPPALRAKNKGMLLAATLRNGSDISDDGASNNNNTHMDLKNGKGHLPHSTPGFVAPRNRPYAVVAVEEEDDDDIIPGPPAPPSPGKTSISKILGMSKSRSSQVSRASVSGREQPLSTPLSIRSTASRGSKDEMDMSLTEHRVKGNGILASRADLNMPPEEFAAGCNLLQAAAAGELSRVQQLLQIRPTHVNFRDYDRRTALHVAASEGHLEICKYLVQVKQADRKSVV